MKNKLNKKLIVGLFLVGILLVSGFLVLYSQKYPNQVGLKEGHEPENVSITEFFGKLKGGTFINIHYY